MCRRYTLHSEREEIEAFFEAKAEAADLFTPDYNVAPGTVNPLVLAGSQGQRKIDGLKWGLIPSGGQDKKKGSELINAPAEKLNEEETLKKLFISKRCIIPANGFYEWKTEQQKKQPFYIRLLTHELMGFAGLYEKEITPEGDETYSYTIITTEANALVAPLHDRMPAILRHEAYEMWLNPENKDPDLLSDLLKPYELTEMATYRVSDKVNKTENNDPKLIQPIPK